MDFYNPYKTTEENAAENYRQMYKNAYTNLKHQLSFMPNRQLRKSLEERGESVPTLSVFHKHDRNREICEYRLLHLLLEEMFPNYNPELVVMR